ncbi:MAG: hypothetical protein HY286_17605 [Planctomycetes bacterium]|nr:hypothetical protein [Planctomycetota bacterium]
MPTTANRRRFPRSDREIDIQVRFVTNPIKTKTANVSADGIYFVLSGPIHVEVGLQIGNKRHIVGARLARLESRTLAHDQLGIALRLDRPITELEGKKGDKE